MLRHVQMCAAPHVHAPCAHSTRCTLTCACSYVHIHACSQMCSHVCAQDQMLITHVHAHTCAHTCTLSDMHSHMCKIPDVQSHMHAAPDVHLHVHAHPHVRTQMCTAPDVHSHVHAHVHTHAHSQMSMITCVNTTRRALTHIHTRALPDVHSHMRIAPDVHSPVHSHTHEHPCAAPAARSLPRLHTHAHIHTHTCTFPCTRSLSPADVRLSTSRGMKSLSSELRAQSFMPRRPFMGKLMSLETAETGSLWMLITAQAEQVSPSGSPAPPRPRAHPTAHPGCR